MTLCALSAFHAQSFATAHGTYAPYEYCVCYMHHVRAYEPYRLFLLDHAVAVALSSLSFDNSRFVGCVHRSDSFLAFVREAVYTAHARMRFPQLNKKALLFRSCTVHIERTCAQNDHRKMEKDSRAKVWHDICTCTVSLCCAVRHHRRWCRHRRRVIFSFYFFLFLNGYYTQLASMHTILEYVYHSFHKHILHEFFYSLMDFSLRAHCCLFPSAICTFVFRIVLLLLLLVLGLLLSWSWSFIVGRSLLLPPLPPLLKCVANVIVFAYAIGGVFTHICSCYFDCYHMRG